MMARVVRRELSAPIELHSNNHLYHRRSHRDALKAAGAGRQWLACPVLVAVHLTASMSADAVSFPKGVFPPDADFGKGGHVPTTHEGSGGVQRGRTVGSSPLGRLFWFFSARGRKEQLKLVPPTFRRVHFSTVGGLHGVHPPRLKNLFFKNRFLPTSGEYTSPPSVAFTACACQG